MKNLPPGQAPCRTIFPVDTTNGQRGGFAIGAAGGHDASCLSGGALMRRAGAWPGRFAQVLQRATSSAGESDMKALVRAAGVCAVLVLGIVSASGADKAFQRDELA